MPIPTNPFGTSDQALSKNTGHANHGNLVAAFIPRSTTKFVEVIGDGSLTGVSPAGTYDSDGYWFGNNGSTRQWCQIAISALNTSSDTTVIVGLKHNGSGSSDGTATLAGLRSNASNGYIEAVCLSASRTAAGYMADAAGNLYGVDYNFTAYTATPGQDTFATAVKSSPGAQSGLVRQLVSGTNTTTAFSGTGSNSIQSGNSLDRIGIFWASKYGVQYIFVYNTVLGDSAVEAIADDPGAVLTYTGGSARRQMMLGVG